MECGGLPRLTFKLDYKVDTRKHILTASINSKAIHTHFILTTHTVDGERFARLHIHGFSAIKIFTEIFSCCLGHKYSLISTIKERYLYSRKNFHGTPETVKNTKV